MAKRAAQPQTRPKATRRKMTAPESVASNEPNGTDGSNGSMYMDASPNEDEIRVRAYQRYLERGAGHGADFDDWVQAEKDLKVAHN
jgi:hypothetical protein